ncbi:MAG: hypothetical protein EU532_04750 [Promethearchaeota archaeon]|nr:MAG: hypothetical protein EU532_04750 [Candidatus Lokiarchaeota archaeon]
MKSEVISFSNRQRKRTTDEMDLYNIWEDNPSFQDINNIFFGVKSLSIFLIMMFFVISTYMLTTNILMAMMIGFFTFLFFLLAFSELKHFSPLMGKSYKNIKLFENFAVFFINKDPEILYITNKKELRTFAISIFQIKMLPETTSASINQFLKSLNEVAVPFTFQIHQSPVFSNFKDGIFKEYEHQNRNKTMNSFQTFVFISVYYDMRGILTSTKLLYLQKMLKKNIHNMRTAFAADYHHYKAELLSNEQLIHALRGFALKKISSNVPKQMENIKPKFNIIEFILKISFCSFILFYSCFLLVLFELPLYFTAIVLIAECVTIFWIWWRSLLYYCIMIYIFKREEFMMVDPFEGITTYHHRNFPESIFLLVDNKMLIKHSMLNLSDAAFRYYPDKYDIRIPSFYPEKFYHAIIDKKIPFIYTVNATPMSYFLFNKIAYKYLNSNIKGFLYKYITSDKRGIGWLEQRSGVWKTILTTSTYVYKYIDILSDKDFMQLANKSEEYVISLQDALKMIYHRFEMVPLTRNRLISGYLFETFKSKLYTLTGTRLKFLLIQGYGLKYLTKIEDLFKKGIETRLPVEFNSPLYLENFITFGHTLNTELWKKEIPVGFTPEQIKNLLIVNGTNEIREKLAMKLVVELITVGVPSLIFDFNGDWSKLIRYFSESPYRNQILHFKLGTAFGLDILHSDIPYDQNNPDYLEYIYDSFALAFKKDNEAVEYIRNTIKQNPDMDMTSLNLELENQPRWEKTKYTNTIISLFDDLTERDLVYFNVNSMNKEGVISFLEFISDNKTVIVDLCSLNDVKKKIFAMFIILSKIIHYINYFNTFQEKIIIFPHIDLAFNEKYLDKALDLGKVDKFLEPLRREGFGLISLVNQIHYLHPHVIKKFKNIVTFQAADYRDNNILRNIIGLQEFAGQGYYSKTRNTTYQTEYVKRMNDDEVILKREDTNQPFIAQLEVEDIENEVPMQLSEIIDFMKEQGYNLRLAEQHILEQAKKTIFEKDFGENSEYIGEIIIFLDALKQVHNISLYESKVKEELFNVIKQKALQQTKDNRSVRKLRDRLFNILVSQRYLVEAHPRDAGGQETMSTCYRVGEHYDKALRDYYQVAERNALIDVENIYVENELDFDSEGIAERELIINSEIFNKILAKEEQELYFDLFQIFKYISKTDFHSALMIEKRSIKKFLTHLYQNLYNKENEISNIELRNFCEFLAKNQLVPFTKKQLINYLEHCEKLNLNDEQIELTVKSTYEILSDFFNRIQGQLTNINNENDN